MTNQKKQIVVIGAGYAGMLATMRLAGKTRPNEITITLFFLLARQGPLCVVPGNRPRLDRL